MEYIKTTWVGKVDTKPDNYTIDGVPAIIEKDNSNLEYPGTEASASVMNNIEDGIYNAAVDITSKGVDVDVLGVEIEAINLDMASLLGDYSDIDSKFTSAEGDITQANQDLGFVDQGIQDLSQDIINLETTVTNSINQSIDEIDSLDSLQSIEINKLRMELVLAQLNSIGFYSIFNNTQGLDMSKTTTTIDTSSQEAVFDVRSPYTRVIEAPTNSDYVVLDSDAVIGDLINQSIEILDIVDVPSISGEYYSNALSDAYEGDNIAVGDDKAFFLRFNGAGSGGSIEMVDLITGTESALWNTTINKVTTDGINKTIEFAENKVFAFVNTNILTDALIVLEGSGYTTRSTIEQNVDGAGIYLNGYLWTIESDGIYKRDVNTYTKTQALNIPDINPAGKAYRGAGIDKDSRYILWYCYETSTGSSISNLNIFDTQTETNEVIYTAYNNDLNIDQNIGMTDNYVYFSEYNRPEAPGGHAIYRINRDGTNVTLMDPNEDNFRIFTLDNSIVYNYDRTLYSVDEDFNNQVIVSNNYHYFFGRVGQSDNRLVYCEDGDTYLGYLTAESVRRHILDQTVNYSGGETITIYPPGYPYVKLNFDNVSTIIQSREIKVILYTKTINSQSNIEYIVKVNGTQCTLDSFNNYELSFKTDIQTSNIQLEILGEDNNTIDKVLVSII